MKMEKPIKTFTRKCSLILLIAVGWPVLSGTLLAEDTNAPKTKLEAFEAQTGVTIVKGSVLIGSVNGQNGVVSIRCKESRDASTDRKESGLAIEVREGEAQADTTVIDYDELDSFLNAIDYISRVDYRVTTLPFFDVVYTTKGGLRIAAYSSARSPGTIQAAVHSSHITNTRVLLSPQQLARFLSLIQESKAKLDSLRAGK